MKSLTYCLVLIAFASSTVSAQLPGKLRVPKIGGSKTAAPISAPAPDAAAKPASASEPAKDEAAGPAKPNPPATAAPAATEPQPTEPQLAKDSLQIRAFTFNVYKKNYDIWSWVPEMKFRVNGPIASGSKLYVEFNHPGAASWVKFDCPTGEVQAGYWWKSECGGREIAEDMGSTYTGVVNFKIQMRNELAGTDATLFAGKMKVGKARSNENGPKAVNKFVYFVDHDWNLPIGYVYYTPDDVRGWKIAQLHVAFWARGDAYNFEPHLFFQGKEVAKLMFEGREVGKPSCSPEAEIATTHYMEEAVPQKGKWARIRCTFYSVQGWDKSGEKPGMFGPLYQLAANPGEYEVKVLWNNRLARSIKFTALADGKLDYAISKSNQLGSDRAIVPVQIIGDQDGKWDRLAWKADAFYGNPLQGFTALP